jgi:uncharacterized repeat protein (TIGR03803 family)
MSMRLFVFVGGALLASVTTLSAQTFTVLHNFGSQANDPGGPTWTGAIAQSQGGYFFTSSPGAVNGKAYRLTTAGALKVVHGFNGTDGGQPYSGLTMSTDGVFYGATELGGAYGIGTIFKMTSDGHVTTLHSFTSTADGGNTWAPPIESLAGEFYGVARSFNPNYGTVYKVTKSGVFTILHAFTGGDGAWPTGQLVQGSDYYFYGTTQGGGALGHGTIFKVNSTGDFHVLYNFDGFSAGLPIAGLTLATDGNLYGVTLQGGASGAGTVFRFSLSKGFAALYEFSGGEDGASPYAGLMQATDGNLYGSAFSGGSYGGGVIFRVALDGTFTVVHSFDGSTGSSPQAAIVQGTNGILYGATTGGGSAAGGVFYSLDVGMAPFVRYLPVYGRAGQTVEILGQGFTSDSTVSFNGVPAKFTVVYPTYLRATVPAGATTGSITVTTPAGVIMQSDRVFVVHPQ